MAEAKNATANSRPRPGSSLAADDAALKASGDAGAKASALSAQLSQSQADLAAARAQLAQATRSAEAAQAESARKVAALEKQQASFASDLAQSKADLAQSKALVDDLVFAITPDAIARAIAFAIEQPADVDVGEIVVRPTAQG